MRVMKFCLLAVYTTLVGVCFLAPNSLVSAQEIHNEYKGTWHGKVIEVLDEEVKPVLGTDVEQLYQTIKAEVLDGPKEGEEIIIENDYLELQKGDKFYFNYNVYIDGTEAYGIINIDRKGSLYFLIGFFCFGSSFVWWLARSAFIVCLNGKFFGNFLYFDARNIRRLESTFG
jgi:uncharacterized membrane protein